VSYGYGSDHSHDYADRNHELHEAVAKLAGEVIRLTHVVEALAPKAVT
jgi:hypothetical protein